MPGFLGTAASVQADINLILQITILILLLVGRRLAKNKKLLVHGRTMGVLLVLHTAAILMIMIPSFLANRGALGQISDPRVIVTWIHAVLGSSAEVLGVFLVSKWGFQSKAVKTCVTRKKYMNPTFALWGLSAILGIAFYVVYYL